jgi:hypothetical protein
MLKIISLKKSMIFVTAVCFSFVFLRGIYWFCNSTDGNVHIILSSQYSDNPSSVELWVNDQLYFKDVSFENLYKEISIPLSLGFHRLEIKANGHECSEIFYVFPVRWIYIEIQNFKDERKGKNDLFVEFSSTPFLLM